MKEAYYFSHDSNARNDTKILAMRSEFGTEGYGRYWIIIEVLRDESEYKLKLTDSTYKALAMQMQCKPEEAQRFIQQCINEYELFETDDASFWSESLIRRMEKKEKIKESRRNAANKRWENTDINASAMQVHSKSNASAMQNDAKERKGKEKKGKEILKEKKEDTSLQIFNLRSRYSLEELSVIDEYFGILRFTRRSGKIADSVIVKIYTEWEKHSIAKVMYALRTYINNPKHHDKQENYCYGIMRNAKAEEIEKKTPYKAPVEDDNPFRNRSVSNGS